jgi:hypothetical protein
MIGGEMTIRASAGLYYLDRTTVLSWLTGSDMDMAQVPTTVDGLAIQV